MENGNATFTFTLQLYQLFCHVDVNSLIIEELWNESTWLHPICLDVETQDSGY